MYGSELTELRTDGPMDGPTDGTLISIKGPQSPNYLSGLQLATMVRVERQSETEVLYHHQMKMLSQAIETLVAQHSEELHYYKNFDFAKRYTIQLDEKTIPDYNAPAYVLRNHVYATNEEGRKTIYHQFDFYHFEQRLISGKEIQDKKKVNVLAVELARDVRKYRQQLAGRSRLPVSSDSE